MVKTKRAVRITGQHRRLTKEHPQPTETDDQSFARLEQTVTTLLRCMEGLSEDQRQRSPDGWGAWEVLAHIVAWHERFVVILVELSQGRAPPYAEGTFSALNCEHLLVNSWVQ